MNLAFFASHGGSNMQAILDACSDGRLSAKPVLLICNNPDAQAIKRAQQFGMPTVVINARTHPDAQERTRTILHALRTYRVELVVLAGYMKRIPPAVIQAYPNRILNIHPALLPDFGGKGMYGMRVHEAVIAAGAKESGPTVHLVNEQYDDGSILAQIRIAVQKEDTPESLAERVLREEHRIYWQTIDKIIKGEITLPDVNTTVKH